MIPKKFIKYILIQINFLVLLSLIDNSFGESPSFVNQHIDDEPIDSNVTTNAKDPFMTVVCNTTLYIYKILPEIFSASYSSNGKSIDTTLWLNETNKNNLSSIIGLPMFENVVNEKEQLENITDIKVTYELMIDVISTYDKGNDFSIAIEWDNQTGNWFKQIKQWSSPSDKSKILGVLPYSFHNYEDNNEHEYVNFTFALKQIGYPTDYNIMARSYSFVNTTAGVECRSDDLIDLITIPPPKFNIYLEPSSLTLQPGQKNEINIKINSSTNLNSVIHLPQHLIIPQELDLEFIPSKISLPPQGSGASTMLVSSIGNTKLSRIIPIVLEAKFPQNLTNSILNSTEYSEDTGILLRSFPQINVVEPPKFFEQISGIFNNSSLWLQNFAGYITTIGTITTGIIGLIAFLRKKKENNNNQENGKNIEKMEDKEQFEKDGSRSPLGNIYKKK